MLVVIVVADVIAGVVQQGGVAQRVAILGRAADTHADGVEQLQCDLLHMLRVWLLVLRALGELLHAAPASLARIGRMRRHFRRLEQQPFANAVCRRLERANVEERHHLGRHGHAGDDDVGACRIQPGHHESLHRRHLDQLVEQVLQLTTTYHLAVHRACGGDALLREQHAGHVGERAT